MALKEGLLLRERPLLTIRRSVIKPEVEADRPGKNIQHFLSNNKYLLSVILRYKRTDIICANGQSNYISIF